MEANHHPLTELDIAILMTPTAVTPKLRAGLVARLRQRVLTERAFSPMREQLESLAQQAGLPADMDRRMTTALRVQKTLEELLAAEVGDLEEPALRSQALRVGPRYLLSLAESYARRADPPAGLERVRQKLASLAETAEQEEQEAEKFASYLLSLPERRAWALLGGLFLELLRRREDSGETGAGFAGGARPCQQR
jgi:hypothetical protein